VQELLSELVCAPQTLQCHAALELVPLAHSHRLSRGSDAVLPLFRQTVAHDPPDRKVGKHLHTTLQLFSGLAKLRDNFFAGSLAIQTLHHNHAFDGVQELLSELVCAPQTLQCHAALELVPLAHSHRLHHSSDAVLPLLRHPVAYDPPDRKVGKHFRGVVLHFELLEGLALGQTPPLALQQQSAAFHVLKLHPLDQPPELPLQQHHHFFGALEPLVVRITAADFRDGVR